MKDLPLTSSHLQTSSTVIQNSSSTFLWSAAGFTVFTVSWKCTNGGYTCCIPLLVLLLLYSYWSQLLNIHIFKTVFSEVKSNVSRLVHQEKRNTAFIVIYWLVKVALSTWYPEGEKSNGTPYSLVFFTIFFITLYIAPTVICTLVNICISCFRKCSTYNILLRLRMNKKISKSFFVSVGRWNKSIVLILCLVVLTYICDGDLTSILRYIVKGKPCWPLLISSSMRDTLPYPLQHAWIKTWQNVFSGYKSINAVTTVMLLGREIGEVHRLLPVLIGTYVFTQLVIPHRHSCIKVSLFACITGVVLGGVTSASLKILLHRYRPNAYGDPYMWKGPGTAVVNHLSFSKLDLSFPCGHTTVTCAVATCLYQVILQVGYKIQHPSNWLKVWLLVCLYFYPIVVLVSRVSDCYHWTSDATFGVSPASVHTHTLLLPWLHAEWKVTRGSLETIL